MEVPDQGFVFPIIGEAPAGSEVINTPDSISAPSTSLILLGFPTEHYWLTFHLLLYRTVSFRERGADGEENQMCSCFLFFLKK